MKYISKLIYNIKHSKEGDFLSMCERTIVHESKFKECPYCREKSLVYRPIAGNRPFEIYACEICGFTTYYSRGYFNVYLSNRGFNPKYIDNIKLRKYKIKRLIKQQKRKKNIFKWFYSKK